MLIDQKQLCLWKDNQVRFLVDAKHAVLQLHLFNFLNFLSPMKGEVGKESFQLSLLTPTPNLFEEGRDERNGIGLLVFYWITIPRDYGTF